MAYTVSVGGRFDDKVELSYHRMSRPSTALILVMLVIVAAQGGDQTLASIEDSIRAGRYSDALSELLTYAQAHPDDSNVQCRLGYVYYKTGALNEAVKSLAACLSRNPSHTEAHQVLGFTLIRLQRMDLAEKEFIRAIELSPDSADAHHALGRIYYERGAYADAVRSLARAVELSPRAFAVHQSLGLAYEAVNNVDSARTHLTSALKLNEATARPDVWPYINFAAFQNRRGRHEEALTYSARAVAVMPRSDVAHFQAAKAYCGLRRWPECKRELQLAIEIDPGNPEFFYLLATAQRRLGENDQARFSLDRFQQLKTWEATAAQPVMKRVIE